MVTIVQPLTTLISYTPGKKFAREERIFLLARRKSRLMAYRRNLLSRVSGGQPQPDQTVR